MNHSMPGLPVHHQFLGSLKLVSIELVMQSRHLILCHPLFLLLPILPSIRVFSNESTLHVGWPKYWSFSFSIIPSKEHPGLISLGWTLSLDRELRKQIWCCNKFNKDFKNYSTLKKDNQRLERPVCEKVVSVVSVKFYRRVQDMGWTEVNGGGG